jgi:hypothetical protein
MMSLKHDKDDNDGDEVNEDEGKYEQMISAPTGMADVQAAEDLDLDVHIMSLSTEHGSSMEPPSVEADADLNIDESVAMQLDATAEEPEQMEQEAMETEAY